MALRRRVFILDPGFQRLEGDLEAEYRLDLLSLAVYRASGGA
jgi:hypothetical protein